MASEEFRKHLDALTRLAEVLVGGLGVPGSPNEKRDAERVLDDLWQFDIYVELESHSWADRRQVSGKSERRTVRRNQMLFKSLQVHTREKVRWEALEEWKQAWNTCVKKLGQLRVKARETLENILTQKPGLKDKSEKGSGKKDAFERMVNGVLGVVWQDDLTVKSDCPLVQTRPGGGEGRTQVIFGKHEVTKGLTFSEKALSEEVARACDWASRNLSKGKIVQQVAEELAKMREKGEELEEMLDSLILRPLILRSRCDLCPV